jgi:hypothetical protein
MEMWRYSLLQCGCQVTGNSDPESASRFAYFTKMTTTSKDEKEREQRKREETPIARSRSRQSRAHVEPPPQKKLSQQQVEILTHQGFGGKGFDPNWENSDDIDAGSNADFDDSRENDADGK